MKTIMVTLMVCLFLSPLAVGQEVTGPAASTEVSYQAIGLRLFPGLQASYKTRKGSNAWEFMFGLGGISRVNAGTPLALAAVYQYHWSIPIDGQEVGLAAYAGGGPSFTYYQMDNNLFGDDFNYGVVGAGIQSHVGVEYKPRKLPLSVALDWVPIWYYLFGTGELSGFSDSQFYGGEFGLAARYVF